MQRILIMLLLVAAPMFAHANAVRMSWDVHWDNWYVSYSGPECEGSCLSDFLGPDYGGCEPYGYCSGGDERIVFLVDPTPAWEESTGSFSYSAGYRVVRGPASFLTVESYDEDVYRLALGPYEIDWFMTTRSLRGIGDGSWAYWANPCCDLKTDAGHPGIYYHSTDVDYIGVPEPGSLALAGLGLLGMTLCRRRRATTRPRVRQAVPQTASTTFDARTPEF